MLHPSKARVKSALRRMARPTGAFDAERYFRGEHGLRFYNVGTKRMRTLAKEIFRATRDRWTAADALAFAGTMIEDPYLEAKSVGIEVLALYKHALTPAMLAAWRRWLAQNHSSNWATTDAICGLLIGPLLVRYPRRADDLRAWARHRNMWVRRASIVGLIPLARKRLGLDLLYANAQTLHADPHDLIQKAVGWALREAGKADMRRLERYLRANGPSIPRTTVRYAIERFDEPARRELLAATIYMGSELICTATCNKKSASGKARLETETLQFRGGDLSFVIPFKSISKLSATDGTLRVSFPGGAATFDLGLAAAKWAEKILHPKSRLDKIGVKADWRASAINVDDETFLKELAARVAALAVGKPLRESDAIFLGAAREADLVKMAKLKTFLEPNGALWIVRPKGRPEISETAVMRAGKTAGLVDVKVVSFSPTHTAEKFVIPVAARR
jgi:3-methyladenine DNA glycosylase AlkD